MTLRIELASPTQPEVVALVRALDSYQQALYPADSNHLVELGALAEPDAFICLARVDDVGVGCGAAIITGGSKRYGELKRMYVAPEQRGRGVARAILRFLEDELRARGVTLARLETGIHQAGAIALYARSGYARIEPFGSYAEDPLSLFFEKRLAPQPVVEAQP